MSENTTNTETPTAGYSQPAETPPTSTTESPATYAVPRMMLKRGRHPEVTAGAYGNGRKHNGIKFRKSSLISRFR